MALQDLTLRIGLLMVVACAVAVLIISGGTDLWGRKYLEGCVFLALGCGLAFVFFRNRRIALATVVLAFILVNAGLTAVFHPTLAGILLTIGAACGIYLLALWQARKYPYLNSKNWKILFDHDPKG